MNAREATTTTKATTDVRAKNRGVGFWRFLIGSIFAFALTFIWMLFFTGEVRALEVISGSMEPTLQKGDRLIVRTLHEGVIPRDSVVIFKSPDDEGPELVKRVAGVPGDLVEMRRGLIYVNGILSTPPGWKEIDLYWGEDFQKILGAEEYWVLGDNRMFSHDSTEFGAIGRSLIHGEVVYRYAPGERAGGVQ